MNEEIVIKPEFKVKDYFKVNLYLLAKVWYVWAGLAFLIYIILIKDLIFEEANATPNPFFPYLQITIIILAIFFFLFRIYRQTKKSIKENPRIGENIDFVFNNEYFMEKGDSFEMKHYWKDILKIEEKREWFLFYIQKRKAHLIRKQDLGSKIGDFRNLISNVNLKS